MAKKVIAINAGSSSLKFQLFDMPEETVITKGLVERIGLKDSVFTISVNGEKNEEITDIPNHEVAVKMLLDKLTGFGIISSLDEIEGIGHRVVHGGKYSMNPCSSPMKYWKKSTSFQSLHRFTTRRT